MFFEGPNTPRADEYRQNYPQALKEKLFIPRDKEGAPNYEAIKTARDITERLSGHTWFVSAALHGSQLQGYSDESSDTDMAIFYDSTHLQSKDEDPVKLILGESAKLRKEGRNSEVTIYDLSPASIDRLIEEYVGFRLPWDATPNGLGKLCFPATTPQILDYRKAVGEKMRALPEEKREKLLSSIVDELMYWEKSRAGKVKERIPDVKDLTRKARSEIRDERRERWESRVHEIFGI